MNNLLFVICNEVLSRKEHMQEDMGRMQSSCFHKYIIGNKMNTFNIEEFFIRDDFEWMFRKRYIYKALPVKLYFININLKNMNVINCSVYEYPIPPKIFMTKICLIYMTHAFGTDKYMMYQILVNYAIGKNIYIYRISVGI